MKPTISIKFDQNEYGVYYSGQVVSGKVEISFSKAKKVRGIAVIISGYAQTNWKSKHRSWDEEHNKRTRRRARFAAREDYIGATSYLIGSENNSPFELLPGIHSYNFACTIPSFAPSSFEGTHGHIRYTAKVVLNRPWKSNQTYTIGFTVLKTVDLNYDSPLIRIPAEVEVIRKFWCGFCSSNVLHMRVKIDQTGFVPGQLIPIQIDINNATNLSVHEVRFYLRKLISYRADTPHTDYREEVVDLVSKTASGVLARNNINFNESLLIPAVPPTSQFHSKIIQISYDVKVEAVVRGVPKNPFVTCPITIGTVPLITSSAPPISPQPFELSVPNPLAQASSAPSSSYFSPKFDTTINEAPNSLPVIAPVYNREPSTPNDNIPPPTYEESIQMARAQIDEGEENSLQRNDFLPRYPVYHHFDFPSAPQEFEIAEDVNAGRYPT